MSLTQSSPFRGKQPASAFRFCSNPAHLDQPLFYTCRVDGCEKKFICETCFEADDEHKRTHRAYFSNTSYLLESGLE